MWRRGQLERPTGPRSRRPEQPQLGRPGSTREGKCHRAMVVGGEASPPARPRDSLCYGAHPPHSPSSHHTGVVPR